MKIELTKIHPSPNPIRKTWDEEKMKELMWSLMEEGQVEPIGVRENGAGYIVVWGHRRVEAARRATWKEIEASLVPANEIDNLIQAGIENLSSEDMTADEKADWADRLIKLGLSQSEISRRSTVPQNTISNWLTVKREKESGVISADKSRSDAEGSEMILQVATALGNDITAKNIILNKAKSDNLNRFEVRQVAEAYRDAPTPQVRQAVLKVDVEKHDTAQDIIRKADVIYSGERKIPSLMQAPLVVQGFRDWQELGDSIRYLKHVNQDTATAMLILKQWIGYCETRLAEMKAITEPSND
jgi:ParB/RepB/Spo0J family partition protein